MNVRAFVTRNHNTSLNSQLIYHLICEFHSFSIITTIWLHYLLSIIFALLYNKFYTTKFLLSGVNMSADSQYLHIDLHSQKIVFGEPLWFYLLKYSECFLPLSKHHTCWVIQLAQDLWIHVLSHITPATHLETKLWAFLLFYLSACKNKLFPREHFRAALCQSGLYEGHIS